MDGRKDQRRGEVVPSSRTRVVAQVVQQAEKRAAVSWSASANGVEDEKDTAFSPQPLASPLATAEESLGSEAYS